MQTSKEFSLCSLNRFKLKEISDVYGTHIDSLCRFFGKGSEHMWQYLYQNQITMVNFEDLPLYVGFEDNLLLKWRLKNNV